MDCDSREAITAFVGDFENGALKVSATRDVRLPRHHRGGIVMADEALKSPQACTLDQFTPQATEADTGVEIAEVPAGDEPQVCVGEARTVAMAPLQAEVDRCANQQGPKIQVDHGGGRDDFRDYVKNGT